MSSAPSVRPSSEGDRERESLIIMVKCHPQQERLIPAESLARLVVSLVKKGSRWRSSPCWLIGACAGSLHSDEQAVEQRGALLLADPLDLRAAEARVQRLAGAQRITGTHLVGAGTHAHLEAHLSLVASLRAGVLKSTPGSEECQYIFFITRWNIFEGEVRKRRKQ